MNGYACIRTDVGVLEFESLASDFDTRTVWPVTVRYINANWTSTVNAYRMWNSSSGRRPARFNSIVRLQQLTTLNFSGQPPSDMRLQLVRTTEAGSTTVWSIVNIYYPSMSGALSVSVNGVVIVPIAASVADSIFLKNTTCGASKYFSSNSTLSVVVTGALTCQVRVTLTTSLSMITKVNSDLATFNANGGVATFITIMARALNISASRIVIRDLYEGSTVIDYQIIADPTQTSDPTTVTNNLNSLSNLIQQGVDLGNLGPIISSTGSVSLVNSDGSKPATVQPPAPDTPVDNSSQVTTTTIIIAVIGSVVGIAILVVGIYFLVKKLRANKAALMRAEQITYQNKIQQSSNKKQPAVRI